ncbi:hypothetical protein OSB04_030495 [Centaurea solstitialis]|uniref:Uncharacterized protein n=1 Tax=Centaurea solstitialis TaxID=347529 RepID=A0AA38SR78_9ASTR|nr:hypothetical protein OSB04_030495 [Centaurea solstitialis]
MILKLFGSRNNNTLPQTIRGLEKPLILQIIHAGGRIDRYYMAFPASLIMDKYPGFVLAWPEIFRRPWDSIVPPEEMLVPGQRYFVVPVRTVRKLRRRIWRPSVEIANALGGNRCVRFRNDCGNAGGAEDDGKKGSDVKGVGKKKKVVRLISIGVSVSKTSFFLGTYVGREETGCKAGKSTRASSSGIISRRRYEEHKNGINTIFPTEVHEHENHLPLCTNHPPRFLQVPLPPYELLSRLQPFPIRIPKNRLGWLKSLRVRKHQTVETV